MSFISLPFLHRGSTGLNQTTAVVLVLTLWGTAGAQSSFTPHPFTGASLAGWRD